MQAWNLKFKGGDVICPNCTGCKQRAGILTLAISKFRVKKKKSWLDYWHILTWGGGGIKNLLFIGFFIYEENKF